MSANTKIEWCDHTFNPWTGCMKVSPGCDGCYAEAWSNRSGDKVGKWGPDAPRVRTTPANWKLPLKWNANAEAFQNEHGRRQRVFCASLADVFDNAVDPQWRLDLFDLVEATPNLDWLLLTKRIGNVQHQVWPRWMQAGFPSHVWLGATIVNQEEANRDIPKLLAVPASKRFLSMEPLLGAVNLMKWLDPWTCADCGFHGSENDCGPEGCEKCGEYEAYRGAEDVCKRCGADDQSAKPSCPHCGSHRSFEEDCGFKFYSHKKLIDWVIVGGESGPGARPMHPYWARSLRDQCAAAGVPFLFKQWGEHVHPEQMPEATYESVDAAHNLAGHGRFDMPWRVGKKAAGRFLDGNEHNGIPLAITSLREV